MTPKKKRTTVLIGGGVTAVAIFIAHTAGHLGDEAGLAHGIADAAKELTSLRDGGPTDEDVAKAACAAVAQMESANPSTAQIKSSILQQLGFEPGDFVPYYVSGPVGKATTALGIASQSGPLAAQYTRLCAGS
jgi:hypothetical protein